MARKKESETPPGEAETVRPPQFDPARGKAALAELKAQLDAVDARDFARRNLPVKAAASVALTVARRITGSQDEYARFAALAGLGRDYFDIANVDILEKAAWAAWYAAVQWDTAQGTTSSAKVPAPLAKQAREVEERMQRCCEYHFNEDSEIAPLLDILRPGTSYDDLASDLLGYADIYLRRYEVVRHDKRHYRDTDAADAVKLAEQIVGHLGEALTPEARAALDVLNRAWTFLYGVYRDVSLTGAWLNRHKPDPIEGFPSLVATARTAAGPSKKDADPGDKPPTGK